MQQNNYQKLLDYSLRLLAKRRYTESGILQKMQNKKIGTDGDITKVVKRLKELKLLNDASFADDYIQSRISLNPRGKRMIKLELKLKGIKPEIINNALGKVEIDEEKLATQVLDKKKRLFKGLGMQKKREKIMSILASRGFNLDTIYKIINRC
jgi:regulatory protein